MSIQRRILLPSFGTITNRLNQGVASDVTSSIMSCSSIFFISARTDSLKENGTCPSARATGGVDSFICHLIFVSFNFPIFPVKRLCR